MRNPPPEEYLTWPPPNYIDPETRGPVLIVVPIILITIASIIVGLRLYTRAVLIKNFGFDDWLIAIATVTSASLAAVTITATQYGWGLHVWDNRPEWYADSRLLSWLCQLVFVVNSAMIKASILLSYLRIAPARGFRYTVYLSLFVVAGYGISFGLGIVFTCVPVSGYWDRTVKARCLHEGALLLSGSIINTCTDFWIAFMPAPMLMRIRLPTRQKIILVVLFGFAGLVCIAGIYRTTTLHRTTFGSYDVTWNGGLTLVWGAIETDVGIATASVPALRPLFRRYFPYLLGTNISPELGSRADQNARVGAPKKPGSLYPLDTAGGNGGSRNVLGGQDLVVDEEEGVEMEAVMGGKDEEDGRGSVESSGAILGNNGGRINRGGGVKEGV